MLQPYARSTLPSSGIPTSRCMPFWLESPWDIKSLWKQSFASGKTKRASNSKTRTLDCLMILNHSAMTMNGGTVKVGMMLIGNLLRNLKKVIPNLESVGAGFCAMPTESERTPNPPAVATSRSTDLVPSGVGIQEADIDVEVHDRGGGDQPRALLVRRGFTLAPTVGASAG